MATSSAIFKTVVLCISGFISGSQIGMIGPTLPELKCLFGVESSVITYILLSMGLGLFVGMVITPVMLKRLVAYRYCACLTALVCTFFSGLPVSGINAAFVLVFVGSCATGSLLNVALIEVTKLWPGSVRLIYVLFASNAMGSVLGPLALLPFVSDGIIVEKLKKHNMSHPGYEQDYLTYRTNVTDNLRNSNTTTDMNCEEFITLIQWPYFMFGALVLMLTLLWIYISVKESNHNVEVYQEIEETEQPYRGKLQYAFIASMFVVFMNSQGVYTIYSWLLSTYGVSSDLHLSLSTMTSMTSVFWFCFLFGRVFLGFVPSRIPQDVIFISCLIVMLIGLTLLWFSSKCVMLLWVASVLMGLSGSALNPAGLAWVGGLLPMTPVVTSVLLAGLALGGLYPFLGGQLISNIGANTFPYFLHGVNAVLAISFTIAYVISKYL